MPNTIILNGVSNEQFNDILYTALAALQGEDLPNFNPDYDQELTGIITRVHTALDKGELNV
jgi:hypothetical protein|tara:strand:- start:17 stop:199 length:183 start_codon:yes stop_codon:yes gene_type:complete